MFLVILKRGEWNKLKGICHMSFKDYVVGLKDRNIRGYCIRENRIDYCTFRLIVVDPAAVQTLVKNSLASMPQHATRVFIHPGYASTPNRQNAKDALAYCFPAGEEVSPGQSLAVWRESLEANVVAYTRDEDVKYQDFHAPALDSLYEFLDTAEYVSENDEKQIPIHLHHSLNELPTNHQRLMARYFVHPLIAQVIKVQGLFENYIDEAIRRTWLGELTEWFTNAEQVQIFNDKELGSACRSFGIVIKKEPKTLEEVSREAKTFLENARRVINTYTPRE